MLVSRHMLPLALIAAVVAFPAPTSGQIDVVWSNRFGDASDLDLGTDIAIGPGSGVAVTGRFQGTIDLGGGPLVGSGADESFLAAYSAGGQHLWSRALSGSGDDRGESVAVDAAGNVVVTGCFQNSVDFGGGPLSGGSGDVFLAKYGANGNPLWSKRFGGAGLDSGNQVAFDAAGNVLLTGYFSSGADFGGGPLPNAGGSDVFVAKFDANGAHLWSRGFGNGSSIQQGLAIAVDRDANVLVSGSFGGSVDFGGGPRISAGDRDVFLAKYAASGTHIFSQRFGSTGADEGLDVDVDVAGSAVVLGSFHATVDFGGGPLTAAGASSDIFVAKFAADGQHLWSQRFGGVGPDAGSGVSVDQGNNVIATGWFEGSVDFGGGPLVSTQSRDIFLAKYDAYGGHLWSAAFGGTQEDEGLAVDAADEVLLTGGFEDTFFGPTDKDAFVSKFLGRDPWPAEAETSASNLTSVEGSPPNDFYDDLSAAVWNPFTRRLWLGRNGPGSNSKVWALVENGVGGFQVDTRDGKRAEWTGFADLEGITQASLHDDVVYMLQEDEQRIQEWDLSTYGNKVLKKQWDLSADLPIVSAESGEGITFVPDNFLTQVGFVDQNGLPYQSSQGMGGLMFVGREDGGGGLFAFDLDRDTQSYVFVGEYRIFRFDDPIAYPTPFYEASGLEFDRSSGLLYVWHGPGAPEEVALTVHDLRSTAVAGQSYRLLNTVQAFDGPSVQNYESFAVLSNADCVAGDRSSFSTIDDGGATSLLLYSNFPCAVPEPSVILLHAAGLVGLAGLAILRQRRASAHR